MEKSFIFKIIIAFIAIIIIFNIIGYIFLKILDPIKVSGEAMSPNYNAGQKYLVNTFSYIFSNPKRRDVVVVEVPNRFFRAGSARNTDTSKTKLLKRIIGLPGDKVEFQEGSVYINETKLDEPYLTNVVKSEGKKENVQPDSYFVLGDNRSQSTDSRTFGSVSKADIVGKLLFCYSNCNK